jgi:hypothetical protein
MQFCTKLSTPAFIWLNNFLLIETILEKNEDHWQISAQSKFWIKCEEHIEVVILDSFTVLISYCSSY